MSSIIGTIDPTDFSGDGLDLIGTDGLDQLFGTEGSEFIDAGNSDDNVFGKGGNDLIDAGAGQDIIDAGQGDDSVIGGYGNDIISGGLGNDFLEAGSGDDEILGDDGDDIINGGAGNDTVNGGVGNDSVYGGAGSDLLLGDAGQDVFVFDIQDFADGSVDAIADFELGQDSIIITGSGNNDQLSFDSTTGSVNLNGSEIIEIQGGSGVDPNMEEKENGNYELM
jgi:Ca2+-binding RTX toxin-like protein